MTKPPSIVNFERCYLGAWVLGLLNTIFGWRTASAALASDPRVQQAGPGVLSAGLIVGVLFSALIFFLLWYFVVRKHSVIAKWLVTAFFAFGLISLLASLGRGVVATPALSLVIGLVAIVLQGIAVYMLFRPDARAWFDEAPLSRP